ncbi:MAG TPA: YkvA family protein [Candidatus Binatia bacterium]|jgi:uncharacterized membrane protein YkvA (DUF1232 family)|nr:YkvA family protein [Candidatus Binatia bacterium]
MVGFPGFHPGYDSEADLLDELKAVGKMLKHELKVYQLVLRDPRTPKPAKWLLGLAVGYTLLPFDLIPDFIPVIGHLDDIIIVPLLVLIALKLVPAEVVTDCRSQANSAGSEKWKNSRPHRKS